jgi:hypothetical protein
MELFWLQNARNRLVEPSARFKKGPDLRRFEQVVGIAVRRDAE